MNTFLAIGCFVAALLILSTAWHVLFHTEIGSGDSWLSTVGSFAIIAVGFLGPAALVIYGMTLLGVTE